MGYRTGVADQQLAKIEEDRKHKAELGESPSRRRKQPRSISSSPATSVSTNMSHSPPPKRDAGRRKSSNRQTFRSIGGVDTSRSRGRPTSSRSGSPSRKSPPRASAVSKSNPQTGHSVRGPKDRGRAETDDARSAGLAIERSRKRRRSRSSSVSYTSESTVSGRRGCRFANSTWRSSARHSSVSPDIHGRRMSGVPRSSCRTRSRSHSMDKTQRARERRSMTLDRAQPSNRMASPTTRPSAERHQARRFHQNDRYGSSFKNNEPASPPRKERSLSPFSKRLALTQAMNMHNQ